MSCSNCFNGCAEITSDKCVKYTGETVASLGVTNGDSLFETLGIILKEITKSVDATGILPNIGNTNVCALVSQYLPSEGDITLNDYLIALIESLCLIKTEVDAIANDISSLNSTYTASCITFSNATNTHSVLQDTITKVCSINTTLNNLIDSVLPLTYVKLTELNSLLDDYFASTDSSKHYLKMVPYTVVEFWGSISGKFDGAGVGIGDWEKIYLCNGQNGTPDKRGRATVSVTNVPGGSTPDSDVNPANGHPNYTFAAKAGTNKVSLTNANQLPSHTHVATVNVTVAPHYHYSVGLGGVNIPLTSTSPINIQNGGQYSNYTLMSATGSATLGKTSLASDTVNVTVTNASIGNAVGHDNVQPVIACYYIMYIP